MFSICLAFAAVADVVDVTITETGTRQFSPGDKYGSLKTAVAGEVRLTSSGAATQADKVSFTNFNMSVSAATNVFDGGWWDFGVADTVTPAVYHFLSQKSTLSSRSIALENGSVVSNVCVAYLAGSSGTDNSLTLDGSSTMCVKFLRLGCSTSSGQRTKVSVKGGSAIKTYQLSLSEGSAFRPNGKNQTGNELSVSGTGSRLVVGQSTSLGRELASLNNSSGAIGGSTLRVVDGASASLGQVLVGQQYYHGCKNRLEFGRNANVTMTSLLFGDKGIASVGNEYCTGENVLEIFDGATVVNSGDMTFGANYESQAGNRIVISNATFRTKLYAGSGMGGRLLMFGPKHELVISGSSAEFTINGTGPVGYFYGAGSSFIVENGATFVLPSTAKTYGYTQGCSDETMLFCTGARVTAPGGLKTGNSEDTAGTSNRLVVASGASFTATSILGIYGTGSRLEVDDATLVVSRGTMDVGGNLKNNNATTNLFAGVTFRIAGSHPSVRVDYNLTVFGSAQIVFALPTGGYDEGHATEANPLVICGPQDPSMGLAFVGAGDAPLAFENVKAFMESHERRKDYVLMESSKLGGLTAARIARASEGFPAGMTLENTGTKLVLHVRPQCGMCIIYK